MSGGKGKRRPPRPSAAAKPEPARADAGAEPTPRRLGLFSSALLGAGDSPLPPIGRSLGRGALAVACQPVLLVIAVVLVVAWWVVLLALGYEGVPGRLVDVLALPPICTLFDLGTGGSLYGLETGFLIFMGVSILVRGVVYAILAGLVLEAVEDGRVTRYGVLRGVAAIPTVLVVHVASFSLIILGNLFFPFLGPGIGFLGVVLALVGGVFFFGFAPTASLREGRPVLETIRRSARAAMLPGGRQLMLCFLYFFVAVLPLLGGLAPGGGEITANPTLVAWLFILAENVLSVCFMGVLAYRWVVAEESVPEQPVRRRAPARAPAPRTRRR